MIKRLRRRMTLMVIVVLILVSAGIVLAIHLANERNIAVQAEETLAVLADGSASPAEGRTTPPPKPSEDDDGNQFGRRNGRGMRGQPPELRSGGDVAAVKAHEIAVESAHGAHFDHAVFDEIVQKIGELQRLVKRLRPALGDRRQRRVVRCCAQALR